MTPPRILTTRRLLRADLLNITKERAQALLLEHPAGSASLNTDATKGPRT